MPLSIQRTMELCKLASLAIDEEIDFMISCTSNREFTVEVKLFDGQNKSYTDKDPELVVDLARRYVVSLTRGVARFDPKKIDGRLARKRGRRQPARCQEDASLVGAIRELFRDIRSVQCRVSIYAVVQGYSDEDIPIIAFHAKMNGRSFHGSDLVGAVRSLHDDVRRENEEEDLHHLEMRTRLTPILDELDSYNS